MADSASELESDTSSVDGGPTVKMPGGSQFEQLRVRVESLQQENRVLKMELETHKLKCKQLQEENKELRRASVTIQARAEQEEEFISNTLLKKIQELKREKEKLAMNYEQEEEYLTNDLSRKLTQLRQEKLQLETNLVREQENQVKELMRRIEKLESETMAKQNSLEQLRREKVELENALEQEQEALVNRLWKKMEKLEAEKRMLQEKLEQPVSAPPSPRDPSIDSETAGSLSQNIQSLRGEVSKLRNQLNSSKAESKKKLDKFASEEKHVREENLRLQRKLQMEIERREQLCRHLSESESSLEMDDERIYNEMAKQHDGSKTALGGGAGPSGMGQMGVRPSSSQTGAAARPRTVSSPIPVQPSRPLSPGLNYGSLNYHQSGAFSPTSPMGSLTRSLGVTGSPPVSSMMSHLPAHHAAAHLPHAPGGMGVAHHHAPVVTKVRPSGSEGRFVKPHPPPPSATEQRSPGGGKGPQSPMQVDKRSQSPMHLVEPTAAIHPSGPSTGSTTHTNTAITTVTNRQATSNQPQQNSASSGSSTNTVPSPATTNPNSPSGGAGGGGVLTGAQQPPQSPVGMDSSPSPSPASSKRSPSPMLTDRSSDDQA